MLVVAGACDGANLSAVFLMGGCFRYGNGYIPPVTDLTRRVCSVYDMVVT